MCASVSTREAQTLGAILLSPGSAAEFSVDGLRVPLAARHLPAAWFERPVVCGLGTGNQSVKLFDSLWRVACTLQHQAQ